MSLNRSISNSKSTSTPVSIVEIPIPENEDLDAQHHSTSSNLSSVTKPTLSTSITPLHTHDNDSCFTHTPSPRKSARKSPKKSSKYYKNLKNNQSSSSTKARASIEIHAKRRYKLDDGRCGMCQFIGQTSFAKGIWVGIVVESGADGGNTNGTVYGKKYFQCRDGKGLFVRPNKITQALGSTYSTRARAKSAKNDVQKNNKLHNKSTSADTAMLSMSTASSSPQSITKSKSSALINQNNKAKHKRKKHIMHPPPKVSQVKFKKSKSYQPSDTNTRIRSKSIKDETTETNKTKVIQKKKIKRRKTCDDEDDIRTPTPDLVNNHETDQYLDQYLDIYPPLTPTLEHNASKSVDSSPHITPISPGTQFSDIPLISPNLLSPDSIGSSDLENDGVVMDTFSALRAYFDDHDALSDEGGYSLRDKLWESSEDDSSEGARSDSMLDDEDWVNRQHRARQASLAQSLADALTIPALHSIQKKMGVYIGSREKWKPPKYNMVPDHSNPLEEKLLHHKKHLDQHQHYSNKKRIRKLGPIEIGTTKGFKMPKYNTVSTPESKRKLSFLDQDKGWYHKPSKINNDKLMSPIKGGKKRSNTPKISKMTTHKKVNFEEEKGSVTKPPMKATQSTPNNNTLKKTEHQRSMSELPKSKKKKKKLKKNKKTIQKLKKIQAEPEWFESDLTWVKRKKRKLGPRDVGRNNYKGTKLKNGRKSAKNKKKKRNRKKPQTISLPQGSIHHHSAPNPRIHKKDTPQSAKSYASSSSQSTTDSVSPFPLTSFQKNNMKKTANLINEINEKRVDSVDVSTMNDYLTMSIIDDEEDEKDNIALVPDIPYKMGLNEDINTTGSSVSALFRTDAVIFEDADFDSTKKRHTVSLNDASKNCASPNRKKKKGKTKKKKSKEKKAPRNERSVSLFSGSSNQIQKEKQQKTAKKKAKQMNSAKKMVQNGNVKKKKNTKNANKNSKIKNKGKKKKIKIFHKPNARNPTYG